MNETTIDDLIPCNEKLPEIGQRVLGLYDYSTCGVSTCYFILVCLGRDGYWTEGCTWHPHDSITHWMPLPKIQKKERDMRKIIKHGNVNDKKDHLYHFKCERCGCEWLADSNGISSHVGGMGHIWINSNCPDCDKIASIDTAIR